MAEQIGLEHFQIEADTTPPVVDGVKMYGFSLVSVTDRSFKYQFATPSCKEAVAWLVS